MENGRKWPIYFIDGLPNLKMAGSFHGKLLVITRWYPFFIGWSERPHSAMNSPPGVARSATSFVQRPHVWAVAWAVRSGLDMAPVAPVAPLFVPLFVGSTGEKKTST